VTAPATRILHKKFQACIKFSLLLFA